MSAHRRYMPNVIDAVREEALANMTDDQRKEAIQQERLDEMEAAREAMNQAKQNLDQARARDQELQKQGSALIDELNTLQQVIDGAGDGTVEATRDYAAQSNELKTLEDELRLLQHQTIPNLQERYDRAVLEYELKESLTGQQGYLTRDEVDQLIAETCRQLQDIIEETLTKIRASDKEVQTMTAAVERAQKQGIIDPRPHNAPTKVVGEFHQPQTLFINGQAIPRNQETRFEYAVNRVYDQALRH